MKNIKRWLSQRDQSLAKTEPVARISLGDFMQSLEQELGPDGRAAFQQLVVRHVPFLMAKQYAPVEAGLTFLTKYLSTPGYRDFVLNEQPSNFHRQLLTKSVNEFGLWAAEALKNLTLNDVTLRKDVAKKDWNRVASKHNPDAELTVPAKPHLTQSPVHPEHAKMLKNPNVTFEGHKLDENGISAKMVHEIEGDDAPHEPSIYMAKPYHKKIESGTKSWVKAPILGWATMATKALFNAGDMGDRCEDVSAHEHEGVPLTVHKFAHDYQMISKVSDVHKGKLRAKDDINQDDVHQIGVMDYLANNLDRHHGNLMVSNHTDATGTHPLLAIDHERNFQYSKPISHMSRFSGLENYDAMQKETPWAYIKGSPGLSAAQSPHTGWYSHEHLVDWWTKHGQKIKDEMENQVGNIKDETLRNHVRDNFNNRWHKMNEWSKAMQADPEGDNMYDASSLHHAFKDTRNIQMQQPRISAAQLKSLPKNKTDALVSISDMVNKKEKLTMNQRQLLHDAVKKTIASMTPEEAGETFRSLAENPYLETKAIRNEPDIDPRNQMLRHFSEQKWEGENSTFKYPHMEAIANAIDSLAPDRKEILKHWADHYRRLLSERQAA
jgi:hypothetical protein